MQKISALKFLDLKTVKAFLGKTGKLNVLVIGDLILDWFIWGQAGRISPEAPVPIVEVKKETCLAGGAGNVCLNLAELGASVTLAARIGEDLNGQLLMDILNKKGIRSFATRNDLSTITKTRIIASSHGSSQQIVRIDREKIEELSGSELKKIESFLRGSLSDYDCVIVSDYGKGMIVPSLIKLLSSRCLHHKKIITVDPKTNHFHYYKKVSCLTPNQIEASAGMRTPEPLTGEGINELGRKIIKKLKCSTLIITQGKEGMTAFDTENRIYHLPAVSKEVYDVTGAGDTVISVLTLALASGMGITGSAILANFAAGVVVQKIGTASILPGELETMVKENIDTLEIEKT